MNKLYTGGGEGSNPGGRVSFSNHSSEDPWGSNSPPMRPFLMPSSPSLDPLPVSSPPSRTEDSRTEYSRDSGVIGAPPRGRVNRANPNVMLRVNRANPNVMLRVSEQPASSTVMEGLDEVRGYMSEGSVESSVESVKEGVGIVIGEGGTTLTLVTNPSP